MTEFNFDLESLSELGLAPELLQPKDGDLFLGLQDDMSTSTHNTGLDLFTSTTNIKFADLPGMETTYLDRSEDLFSFLEMADIKEVSDEVPNGANILINAIEESGIGSPTSSMGKFSPAGETFLPNSDSFSADGQQQVNSPAESDLEDTQNLIDEVENYLKAVEGTSTILEENIPITIEGNPALAEEIPVIIQEAVPTAIEEDEPMEILPVMSQEVTIKSGPEALLQALATGKVALNDSGVELTEADLSNAITTTMVTQDGQNVVIIIAAPSPQSPASPANSYVSDASFVVPHSQSVSPRSSMSPEPASTLSQSDYDSSYETDPDYSPSSYTPKNKKLNSFNYQYQEIAQPEEEKPRRKYQRHKKPQAPLGPYPLDKKERKKAQNRTAAFRYREKKKQESEVVEDEVSKLVNKNKNLKEKLTDVENELRIIKKLMTEAGLGKYARAAKI
jgi:hypothetical protein